jgi:hypothetical protein
MQQWHKGSRPETVAAKQEGIQQDLQGDPRAGDRETSRWDFKRIAESEGLDIVEGSAPSETQKEATHGVRAENVGGQAILGSFAPPNEKIG